MGSRTRQAFNKRMAEVDQHPDGEDLQKARDFAKGILAK